MSESFASEESNARRVLVTGGAGFIGSNLAQALSRQGDNVIVADSFAEGDWVNLVDFLRTGDTTTDVLTLEHSLDIDSIRRAGPFEVIYHQAAITGVIASDGTAGTSAAATQRMLRNNVEQFRQILDLAVETGAAVVWASSCSVYGRGPVPMVESAAPDPLNSYAFSKLAMERLAKKYAPRLAFAPVGLRYSNVYGPNEAHKGPLASMVHKLAMQMRKGLRPKVFEHGEQRRDFVYVDDVVAANLTASTASMGGDLWQGEAVVVNAGAGRSWTFNELIGELNRVLDMNLSPDYFPNPFAFTQDHTETDQSLAREKIGHEPRFDLAAGVEAYAASGKLGISKD